MPVPQIFEGIVVLLAAVYKSASPSASTGCLCASAAQFGYDGRRGEARSSVPSVAPYCRVSCPRVSPTLTAGIICIVTVVPQERTWF